MTRPGEPADRTGGPAEWTDVVVRVGERSASLLDVVLTGVTLRRWQEREAATADGLAREALGSAPPEEVRALVIRFRYARKLISAADFRGWLAERGLGLADVERHLARDWLNRNADPGAAVPDDLHALRVDAVCSGLLAEGAAQVGARLIAAAAEQTTEATHRITGATQRLTGLETEGVAAAGGLPDHVVAWLATTPLRERVPEASLLASAHRVAGWQAAHERLRAALATPARLAGALREHHQDWVRVRVDALTFAGAGPAREARLLLAEGVPPRDLERHALDRAEVEVFIDDAEPALQVELLRRRDIGDVVVWQSGASWRTATIASRTVPDLEDPVIGDRARRTILEVELAKLGAGRVVIDAPL